MMTSPLHVRIVLPGDGRVLLEFKSPGDVNPCTPLYSVVSGLAEQVMTSISSEAETSDSDSRSQPENTKCLERVALHTFDMQHPIPLSMTVGMLKTLVSDTHIGPLVLCASFSPAVPSDTVTSGYKV
ncbi:hypothetical protein KIPB_008151 [Kipferlia bialata]|uniref:Uncharacterized protein n=1 Tax=Kipferlia bialata TaxID=797122 RepID=A0A9K3CZJ0_9EUKA|nr:hypothetical protein KIPB_008151 [Kipferlia bialata]|eukprot:g8151.t1